MTDTGAPPAATGRRTSSSSALVPHRGSGARDREDDRRDRYCIDVLQRISAVKAAIGKVAFGMLDEHARHCMATAAIGQQRREEMTTELIGAVSCLVRG